MSTYDIIPEYHWYKAKHSVPSDMHVYKAGQKLVGFYDEPEPNIIDKYGLTVIGYGDFDWLTDQFF